MAKKPSSWTREQYINAVRGIPGTAVPGLRSLVNGFDSSDGFNLHRVDKWTPQKKRSVRLWHERLMFLYAQPRRVLRPKNKKVLSKLQDMYHGSVASPRFKAALMPYVEPKTVSGEPPKVRIRVNKQGVVKVSVKAAKSGFERYEEAFDKVALATDTDAEIKRVLDAMPDARYFFIQCGEFQSLAGKIPKQLNKRVKELMHRYDGVRELPASKLTRKGHAGYDSPEAHKWDRWMDSVIGYEFEEGFQNVDMQREISQGMAKQKENRDMLRKIEGMTEAERAAFYELMEGYVKLGMRRDKAISQASAVIKRRRKRKG